ncbi:MAG: hypothetical protein IJU54_00555 [Alphaproteobacteria bacterium]|nr:hypothetical protein [Alphaproteobacteria bacterium]
MVPQLDTSFYISQIFWLVVCLLVLGVAFKKVFIPRMNKLVQQRADYIKSLENNIKDLEKQVDELSNKLKEVQNKKIIETNKIIERAQYQCDVLLDQTSRELQTENEIAIKQSRKEADTIIRNLDKTLNEQIENVAQELFTKMFPQKKDEIEK